MRDLIIDIQEEIERGQLSFQEIARKFNVPLNWVDIAHGELMQCYMNDSWYEEQFELNDQ